MLGSIFDLPLVLAIFAFISINVLGFLPFLPIIWLESKYADHNPPIISIAAVIIVYFFVSDARTDGNLILNIIFHIFSGMFLGFFTIGSSILKAFGF